MADSGDQIFHNYLGDLKVLLNPRYCVEKHLIEHGSWEPHLIVILEFFVRTGFNCIDVGANAGLITLKMASAVGPKGRVFAFEPNPDYAERLRSNLRLNPSLIPRVHVIQKGASENAGTLKLFETGELLGNSYMSDEYNSELWNKGGPDDYIECPVTAIDGELSEYRIDLIKIDVEGMEAKVLKGAVNTVKAHKPYLVYETLVESFDAADILKMEQLVKKLGYYIFMLVPSVGKLVECSYPNLPPDVIAIHGSRLLSAVPVLFNAVQYDFEGTDLKDLLGDRLKLSIVGLEQERFGLAWHRSDDYSGDTKLATRDGDVVTFTQTIENRLITTQARFLSSVDDIWELQVCEVVIVCEDVVVSGVGKKVGGQVTDVRT